MSEIIVEFPSKLTAREKKMIYGYNGELIRCKDCKHWGMHKRLKVAWCYAMHIDKSEDGYCDSGERSEESVMQFPETWEKFEAIYGYTDSRKVYTNGARLIPSFRVEQWLEHTDPVKHGKWEKISDRNYKCSSCGAWWSVDRDSTIRDFDFCPSCGSKNEVDG